MRPLLRLAAVTSLALLFPAAVPAQEMVKPDAPVPRDQAPGLTWKRLGEPGPRGTFVLVFQPGDEVMSGLARFADAEKVRAATISGIGSFSAASVGFFEPAEKAFRRIAFNERLEATSILGNIAAGPCGPVVHVHATFGDKEGNAKGGHLLDARVWVTAEVFVTVEPGEIPKLPDEATGTSRIQLGEGAKR